MSSVPLSAAPAVDLMPLPAQVRLAEGRLPIEPGLTVAFPHRRAPRVEAAVLRTVRRWEQRSARALARDAAGELRAADPQHATLVIEAAQPGAAVPALGDDESYTLDISPTQAVLRAATDVGALRGLETLAQLLQRDADGWFLPAVSIQDRPRFPWRGLLIDVSRHWQPPEVIKRNLDGMALVKLNVLHLHLSDDQGFRVESKTHPELQERGSDGLYFSQAQLRDIVAYAADRGIRVIPEFDLPGHTTSWFASHPELASAPGPYHVQPRWGVYDPVMDPTNEDVYKLLADFIGEMAAIFPDPYFHIGGDENNGVQWNANSRIQAFIREHGLKDNAGLHTWFNQRLHGILEPLGKKLVGWDEILQPNLPKDAVVQSWRGPQGLADAARAGYAVILSNGYYIDLCFPAAQHYANDPIPADTPLTPEQQGRVLGGEATMWAEWVTPETIDSRVWPRTAAIAERLWSPRDADDVDGMYRRLATVSRRLEEAGLAHVSNRPRMIRRFAGTDATPADLAALQIFVEAIEPVKEYRRGEDRHQPEVTRFSPLTTLADCAAPESESARVFTAGVHRFVAGHGADEALRTALLAQLREWREAVLAAAPLLSRPPASAGDATVAQQLADACRIGTEALTARAAGGAPRDPAWLAQRRERLDRCAEAHHGIELPQLAAIRELVAAAGQP